MPESDRSVNIVLSDDTLVGPGNLLPIAATGTLGSEVFVSGVRYVQIVLSDGTIVGPGNPLPITGG